MHVLALDGISKSRVLSALSAAAKQHKWLNEKIGTLSLCVREAGLTAVVMEGSLSRNFIWLSRSLKRKRNNCELQKQHVN